MRVLPTGKKTFHLVHRSLSAVVAESIERHCKKKKSWKQDVYWIDAELRPHWNDLSVGAI